MMVSSQVQATHAKSAVSVYTHPDWVLLLREQLKGPSDECFSVPCEAEPSRLTSTIEA